MRFIIFDEVPTFDDLMRSSQQSEVRSINCPERSSGSRGHMCSSIIKFRALTPGKDAGILNPPIVVWCDSTGIFDGFWMLALFSF